MYSPTSLIIMNISPFKWMQPTVQSESVIMLSFLASLDKCTSRDKRYAEGVPPLRRLGIRTICSASLGMQGGARSPLSSTLCSLKCLVSSSVWPCSYAHVEVHCWRILESSLYLKALNLVSPILFLLVTPPIVHFYIC